MGNLVTMPRRRRRKRRHGKHISSETTTATANEPLHNSQEQTSSVDPPGVPQHSPAAGAEAPPEVSPTSQKQATWSCPTCTFEESAQRPGCSMCGEERPYDADPDRPLDFLKGQFECEVCGEDDIDSGVRLLSCQCEMCKICLHRFVMDARDGMPNCPKCEMRLPDSVVQKVLSPGERELQISRLLGKSETNLQFSFHCRTPDCHFFVELDPDRETPFFLCAKCRKVNCVECGTQHEGESCTQYRSRATASAEERETEEYLKRLVDEGKAMRCPKCAAIVQHAGGCFWLRCGNPACKLQLCWLTKGPRWGREGPGDTSGGCRCGVDGKKCHSECWSCDED